MLSEDTMFDDGSMYPALRNLFLTASATALLLLGADVHAQAARDQLSIVGSSTVYPFATVVAEQFGRATQFKTPTIESTGTGGGIKLFCSGLGVGTPDIVNASRRIKDPEVQTCATNGVKDIVEIKIGYDGIVLADSVNAKSFDLTLKDVYLALAKNIPNPADPQKLIPNPYQKWSDVRADLPDTRIEVLGPPPTSGTRDAFAELAMEGGCTQYPWIKSLKAIDEARYKEVCHTIREDGRYVEAGENDNLIVQKLQANPNALGIFGYSFLEENSDVVKGIRINAPAYPGKFIEPTFETIADATYPVSRLLFFYVKKAHIGKIPGITEYVTEFTSERSMGEDGYLADRGLIPLPASEYAEVQATVANMPNLDLKKKP